MMPTRQRPKLPTRRTSEGETRTSETKASPTALTHWEMESSPVASNNSEPEGAMNYLHMRTHELTHGACAHFSAVK